jgi:hypothetical protein
MRARRRQPGAIAEPGSEFESCCAAAYDHDVVQLTLIVNTTHLSALGPTKISLTSGRPKQ